MGKVFTAQMPDGSERFAATMSMGRARLFVAITRLLEADFLKMPSGIQQDNGEDEHVVDPELFEAFFQAFWDQGWLGDRNGFLHNWARQAAGMIENMTLEASPWIDRNGQELQVLRYLRPDEMGD